LAPVDSNQTIKLVFVASPLGGRGKTGWLRIKFYLQINNTNTMGFTFLLFIHEGVQSILETFELDQACVYKQAIYD
jgi:hypothetical protein